IVGDMDSVSDGALTCGAQLIAHAYQNGECPGAARLEEMGLAYDLLPAPGTSEDVALLLAHAKKAEIIVLVGSHSNMIDFLEKGRPGMASTFLTRLKIGPILLDAKKVSELYRARKPVPVLPVLFIALVPIVVFLALSSPWRHYLRLLWLQLRLIAGWL
ncbi:MAG: putative cytokinetic ring protein SteA, partial [Limnochordia bacterium]